MLSSVECKERFKQEVRGVLAVNGDAGYPYALPINFYFDEKGNKLYFHSGKVGHKLDAIANSDKVSFGVYDKGFPLALKISEVTPIREAISVR